MQAVNLGVFFYQNTVPCSIPDGSQSVFRVPAALCVHRHLADKAHATAHVIRKVFLCAQINTARFGIEYQTALYVTYIIL